MMEKRHLRDPWRDAFVLELRLQDVRGDRIGDALTLVDEHCTDSGESPEEAFGDPVSYARETAGSVPADQRVRRPSPVATGLAASGLTLAVHALLSGVTGLTQGEPATISAGSLVAAGVAGVLVALITHFFATLVRPGRRVILFAVVWVGTGAVLLPQALIRGTVLDGPAWVFLLAAVVLGAAVWGQLRSPRSDAVRDPRDGADLVPAPRWLALMSRWLLPVVLVLAVVTVLVTSR